MQGIGRPSEAGRLLPGHSVIPLVSQVGISLSGSSASTLLPQDGRMVALKGHRLCDAGSNTRAVPSSRQLGRIAPQMLLLCPLPKLGSDTAPNASSHPSPLGTGIPLILHTPRGSKEQFRCVFFFPSRSLSTHVTNSHVKKALRLPRRQHAPSQGLETSAACVFQTHESARFFVVFFFWGVGG